MAIRDCVSQVCKTKVYEYVYVYTVNKLMGRLLIGRSLYVISYPVQLAYS